MAVVFVVLDDRGNLVRLERTETEGLVGKSIENHRAFKRFASVQTLPFRPGEELYQFSDVVKAIDESPNLTPEQREQARAIFNEFKPGDVFNFVVARGIIGQGGDRPAQLPPLFIVFVDP